MKRSPLLRKTPMRRRGRLVRVPLKPMSDKRRRDNKTRRANLVEEFGEHPTCFIPGCGSPAADGHELLSRARGGSITDVTNVRPVCRTCHHAVTTFPAWAESLGYALPSPPRHRKRPS